MAWMRKRDEVVQLNERKVSSGYFKVDRADVADYMYKITSGLGGVDYDTLVVTGTSGIAIGSVAAYFMEKNLLVIRKEEDIFGSHATTRAEGTLGLRWVFLDDFISQGVTIERVFATVEDIKKGDVYLGNSFTRYDDFLPSKYVGVFEYTKAQEYAFTPSGAIPKSGRSYAGRIDWSFLTDES